MGISKKITIALAMVFTQSASADTRYENLQCLAKNIYFEGRNQPWIGQVAIAQVTLNRVKSAAFPSTICEVVKQKKRNICQFSWYCDGKSDNPQDLDRWMEAQSLAWNVVENGKHRGLTEGATHYHATYVNPRWATTLQLVGGIGEHIFYRWE